MYRCVGEFFDVLALNCQLQVEQDNVKESGLGFAFSVQFL